MIFLLETGYTGYINTRSVLFRKFPCFAKKKKEEETILHDRFDGQVSIKLMPQPRAWASAVVNPFDLHAREDSVV